MFFIKLLENFFSNYIKNYISKTQRKHSNELFSVPWINKDTFYVPIPTEIIALLFNYFNVKVNENYSTIKNYALLTIQ